MQTISTVSNQVAGISTSELDDLIRKRIETLRPKLLDLTRNNPLIATRLSARSNSYIRIVDELPDVLLTALSKQKEMCFTSLPPLNEDPKDENTREFQNAVSEARLTNQTYLDAMDGLDPSSEDYIEQQRKIERTLKDKIREVRNMAPRQLSNDVSLIQHAKNNGISPSYDLPMPSGESSNGNHHDRYIQTLLLPDDLERKMGSLTTKCRTYMQETGIHVLYVAFGFLEWTESSGSGMAKPDKSKIKPEKPGAESNKSNFAPLLLLPVEIEKVKTKEGPAFWIKAIEDEAETNLVLMEKLKHDFSLEIPKFNGDASSLEDYFQEIAKISPKSINWKVRRQVVFGAFPSARIAMYHDLDTSKHSSEYNEAISRLLGGSTSGIASPYGDEYDIDKPEIEKKVPCLVLNADSSQYSAMVDIADGKNLAVEGPPGTGKSQTIVNTIAAALHEGKKVLFVAEKMAALEVVKSRLDAIGLGEFILALQAERSARENVMQSVRDRLEMSLGRKNIDFDYKASAFKEARSVLQNYIDTVSSVFGSTGYTVYEIIGKCISYNDLLEGECPKAS